VWKTRRPAAAARIAAASRPVDNAVDERLSILAPLVSP
jgi:hypothetical protein